MSSSTEVETGRGSIRGTRDDGVEAFRGIPFARPPVGERRGLPPEPPDSWPGVRDAARFGPGSFQADRPLARILGITVPEQSEDCLTLNVWTPAVGDGARRPVLVWVHGGAWVIGAGSESAYDGARLARRGDVVVVTVNYRLGPFGWLRGVDLDLPGTGNEGLLDVIAALEWVRDEIAAFGGDPGNVTLFGNSAGSVNAACLLASPRARGLFHKAILQSGALNLTRDAAAATAAARQVLEEAGIAPGERRKFLDVPARALLDAANRVAGRSLLPPFSPVADGDLVPADPLAAIAAGASRGVPLIVGTNLEEMKLYRFLDPTIESLDDDALVARAATILPGADAGGRSRAARAVEIYRAARRERGEDASAAELWLALTTDHFFRIAAIRLAEAQASHTTDVFAYRLAWKGAAPGKPQGAVHGLELPFVFGTLDVCEIGAIAGRSAEAHRLSERMQDAWLAFARTGRPRAEGLPAWEPYAPPRRATLELGAAPRLVDAPDEAERAFWARPD